MNRGHGRSTVLRCAAVISSIPEGTHLTWQLERKQDLYDRSKQRKRLKTYRTRKQALVREKFELYFQRGTETETGHQKGISDLPLPQCSRRKSEEYAYSKQNKRPMGNIAHLSNLGQYRIFFPNIKYAFHFHLPHPTLGGN
jgi:hypothetical protein